MQKNHIALVFAIFFVGIFAVMSYVSASGWIDQNTTVNPGSYYVDSFQFGQTSQNVQFFVSSNTTVDIYILNGTAMGIFLTSGNLPAPNFPNTQLATEWWNLTYIASRYDLNISHYSDGSDFVVFYILVVNTGNDYANIIVRLGYLPVNDLQDNLETFLHNASIVAFGYVAFKLLSDSAKAKKENDLMKTSILRGYGLGITLLFTEFILADIRSYWSHEIGGFSNTYQIILNLPKNFPISTYDPFIATIFFLAAGDFMFLSYIVEKNIRQRKIPWISYNLILAGVLSWLVFLIPTAALGLFIYLLASLMLAIIQIPLVYIQVIVQNEGIVRTRALMILLGILIPTIALIMQEFVQSTIGPLWDIIWNLLLIFGMLLFYRGNVGKD